MEARAEYIAQQAAWQAHRLSTGGPLEHSKLSRPHVQPGFQLVDQAALPQTRVACDDDHRHAATDCALFERGLDDLEFRFAPDHSSCYALDASSADPKYA